MPYLSLFFRLIVRPLQKDLLRTLLTATAVALGVAVVLAIELAGAAAAGSFRSSVETLVGDADFEVTATGGVAGSTWTQLASLPYALRLRPRIEDYATLPNRGRAVPLIGIDLLADALEGVAANTSNNSYQEGIWTGEGLPWKAGDSASLLINDKRLSYRVLGTLGTKSGDAVVMDLATADALLQRRGMLDRIMVQVPQGEELEVWEQRLRPALPEGTSLVRSGARTEENRRMLGAFRWNLRVLSYIALVVGAFLIYNTISVSVVRRRAEIGILRALGVTRGGVLAAFLGEALCFGIVGGIVGVALGRLLAGGAVNAIAATVDALYVSSRPSPVELTLEMAALGLFLGTAVAVLSALLPAWEASQVSPVEAMGRGRREHEVKLHRFRNLLLALICGAIAYIAAQQPAVQGKPLWGYLSAVLLIVTSALAIPAAVSGLSSASARVLPKLLGVEALLALRSLSGSLRRTAVLVGALSTAIAMMSAVGIMVGSFRQTVLIWMGDRLQADLYLRPAGSPAADRHPSISADLPDRIRRLPEVDTIDRFRAYEIAYEGLPATLGSSDSEVAARFGQRPLMSGTDVRTVFQQLQSGDNVVVSEPFANKHNVRQGDTLRLPLGSKTIPFRVVDLYYDYASERGFVIMDRATMLKYLPDPAPSAIAIYLRKGVSPEQGRRAVEGAIGGSKVLLFSNRDLRNEAIRIFDRTFAITYALEVVAVFVAVLGVAGALLAMVIDRRREFGLLKFLGGSNGQLRKMILFEAGLLGLVANVIGLVLGWGLSLLLIYVINKQSFGWTIQFHWPIAVLLGALSLVYAATVLAGLYPARVAVRLNPIEVIHEE